jgi:diguanylate cyclase (GGDEF)-like protein/PAS domain S-box-containing protein
MLVVPAHGVYTFFTQKEQIIADMNEQARSSLISLSENVVPFMQAYAVNDYQNLVQTEMVQRGYAAILIEDSYMAEVLGRPEYITGMIRSSDGHIVPYDASQPDHHQQLSTDRIHKHSELLQSGGVTIGKLSIFMTDTVVREKQKEVFYDSLSNSLLLAVILMALLIVFSKRRILDPLGRFSEALQQRDADGIPITALPHFKYRELSMLTDTVNSMLDMIRSSREEIKRERSRLHDVIEGTHVGTWEWNIQSGATEFNSRWAEIIGYTLEELSPTSIETWASFVHPDDLKESEKQLQRHFTGESPYYQCEARMKHKAGHWVWVLDRGKVSKRTEDGKPLMMYGTHQDITEQKENELRLHLAASVYEHVSDGIMITDIRGTILDVNAAFCRLTGYEAEAIIGENTRVLRSGHHDESFYQAMWHDIVGQGYWSGEIWNKRKNDEVFPAQLKVNAIRDSDGQVRSFVALMSDISHFKEHERQLEQLAHFDALTGLPNRLVLADRLQKEMAQARRRSEVLAVAFLDLDGFKAVNDQFGHDVGDQLLIIMSERMGQVLRESDTLVRIGGDEFVVLLPDVGDCDSCVPVIKRLLSVASSPIDIKGSRVQVSASIGVTFYPQEEDVDSEQLLRQADQMMYDAKQGGKNRYKLADAATSSRRFAG